MDHDDLVWAAAMIDAEGCIWCKTPNTKGSRWSILLEANNCDPRMAVDLKRMFEVGCVSVKHKKGLKRTVFEWKVTGQKAATVLRLLLPFLRLKRDQAEVALAIQATMRTSISGHWSRRLLDPSVVAEREALSGQLRLLKRQELTLEEVS